ncbi:MAG TPA: hypothetical protein VIV60_01155 [Polyangiaceae bacterium]
MIQPKRWLDDEGTSTEIRELILAGQRPPRFPKVALGVLIVPLAQKAAWASTWSWPAGAVVAAKATTVGLAIGLGSVAAVTTLSGRHSTSSVTTPTNSLVTQQPRHVSAPTGSGALPQSDTTSTPAGVEPVASTDAFIAGADRSPAVTATGEARRVVVATAATGIAAEADLLERARSLLGESPTRALMLTVEHQERFPRGQMSAERELLAIDALLRLGRTGEAQRRATPFLADGTNQVFAARVRHLLERGGR